MKTFYIHAKAINQLYPQVIGIGEHGPVDADNNVVEIDEAAVQTLETQLRAEEDAVKLKQNRLTAFQIEADPLFFKAQRGEATMDEWNAKVVEIRARYPYGGE